MHFPPIKPVPKGFARRMPPAVFPPLLGALALVTVWRALAATFSLPPAFAQLGAGMAVAAALFCYFAYGAKILRRPGVLAEELSILPGRAGCGAAVVSVYLLAVVIGPFAPALARGVLVAGMGLHLAFWAVLVPVMMTKPAQGRVTPVWQLNFVGPIVAALAASQLGWPELARLIWYPAAAMAVFIWLVSIDQARRERIPAPLRPLLAIHLAPVAVLGTVAVGIGMTGVAQVLGVVALVAVAAMLAGLRWLTAAGFSPLWGAFTFPLSATAGLWLALARTEPFWRIPGAIMAVFASMTVLSILTLIWRDWASGRLAIKTNAAIA